MKDEGIEEFKELRTNGELCNRRRSGINALLPVGVPSGTIMSRAVD